MLNHLIPISSENSLRQVVANVFSPMPLVEPERFEKFANDINYQKFDLVKVRTINLNIQKHDPESKDNTRNIGFRMFSYDSGRLNKIIQAEERTINNKETSYYSLQTLKYRGWDSFRQDILNDFNVISREDNPFVNALSLNYVNEFLWDSDSDIEIDKIFNPKAGFISEKFFKSQNSSFVINTEVHHESYKAIEKIEIVVSKDNKRIQTNSQLVFELNKLIKFNTAIGEGVFESHFENIHSEIKNVLKELFTDEVKSKIKLL